VNYERLKYKDFFWEIHTEGKARQWLWKARFSGKDFECPHCGGLDYWQHRMRIEIKECRVCKREIRVRAGTIFEHSKLPLLTWFRAIHLVMQGTRGISAMELQRQLGLGSYRTAWTMLHKIRRCLWRRDTQYQLKGICELDGAYFGRKKSGNQASALIAVESRTYTDKKGREKTKAGFAHVRVCGETTIFARQFVKDVMKPGTWVNTDGDPALKYLKDVEVDYQVMKGRSEVADHWLPLVHRLISNLKAWLLGTYHSVHAKYLENYLAEYTYRFNRRHDLDGLFHRALRACALAPPIRIPVLCA